MIIPSFGDRNELFVRVILVVAAILPPVHLWFEYNFIWRTAKEDKRPPFDQYKYAQETAKNMWLAFVAVLIALYFK
jgi:hypothetical protein